MEKKKLNSIHISSFTTQVKQDLTFVFVVGNGWLYKNSVKFFSLGKYSFSNYVIKLMTSFDG